MKTVTTNHSKFEGSRVLQKSYEERGICVLYGLQSCLDIIKLGAHQTIRIESLSTDLRNNNIMEGSI